MDIRHSDTMFRIGYGTDEIIRVMPDGTYEWKIRPTKVQAQEIIDMIEDRKCNIPGVPSATIDAILIDAARYTSEPH
jgi:hypothetical protein